MPSRIEDHETAGVAAPPPVPQSARFRTGHRMTAAPPKRAHDRVAPSRHPEAAAGDPPPEAVPDIARRGSVDIQVGVAARDQHDVAGPGGKPVVARSGAHARPEDPRRVRQFLPPDAPPFAYVAQSYLRLGRPWREVADVVGKPLDEVVSWCAA